MSAIPRPGHRLPWARAAGTEREIEEVEKAVGGAFGIGRAINSDAPARRSRVGAG
jgi:hypothetical protein